MIFQITHKHTPESCPAVHPEKREILTDAWRTLSTTDGIDVLGAYSSPLDHVFHVTVEADELERVVRALGALNALGTAQTSPVIPLKDLIKLVGEE
jgi:hypothetical protein